MAEQQERTTGTSRGNIRELTCIGCPMGCPITVTIEEGGMLSVTGNTCSVGDRYARAEVTEPRRIVTGTVRVKGGRYPVVSVKTASGIPKEKILDIMKVLKQTQVSAPIHIGDVVVADICGTGVDIVCTCEETGKE